MCPSDSNAGQSGQNSYNGCFGTTTLADSVQTTQGSTGLFTYWRSYKIASVQDGTSNTIAFAEMMVGNGTTTQFEPSSSVLQLTAIAPAEMLDARSNVAAVQAGLQACTAAMQTKSAKINGNAGNYWLHGSQGQTLFNTVAVPNNQQYPWGTCSDGALGVSEFCRASSYHPGGVNILMADGSSRFVKSTINQITWWALGTRAGREVVSADQY